MFNTVDCGRCSFYFYFVRAALVSRTNETKTETRNKLISAPAS